MNFFGQTNRKYMPVLWCLLIFFSVSCSSSEVSEPMTTEITPIPGPAQPVEYGASLSEWEAATQADTDQMVSSDGINAEVAESQDTAVQEAAVAATVTIVTTESGDASSPTEAAAVAPTAETIATDDSQFVVNDIVYQEIRWDDLVPADYTPGAIMAKYEPQLAQLKDGSKEALTLYTQMQEEFNNAPVNDTLNETFVRLPGFIAPLEYTGNLITEFLLVPYFGACIHVPPPPANQTVLVKADEGHGIKPEESYNPVWVMGKLTTEGATTTLAQAGYYVQDAIIEPYTSP